MKRVGLLGGSFNPAHGGHRRISVAALDRLGLDELWWLVSPQNPLKPRAGMAPLAVRMASAEAIARHPRIKVLALADDRYTVDTVRRLQHRHPEYRFIWLIGADNLAEFHRWHDWRGLARAVPIAVFARPGYSLAGLGAPAMAWLRRWRHSLRVSRDWTRWTLPAIVMLELRLDRRSATSIRASDPDWATAPDAPRSRISTWH